MVAERRIGDRGRIESKNIRRKWERFRRGAYGSTLYHRQAQVLGAAPPLAVATTPAIDAYPPDARQRPPRLGYTGQAQ